MTDATSEIAELAWNVREAMNPGERIPGTPDWRLAGTLVEKYWLDVAGQLYGLGWRKPCPHFAEVQRHCAQCYDESACREAVQEAGRV